MPTLYSYCIPYDDGAAPNPYWGTCTLVICKPVIRRNAQVGDWIVGTGSAHSPIKNIRGKVVYAMRVSQAMTMKQYDQFTLRALPAKIPDWRNYDVRRRLGDSIYDFSTEPPTVRRSVHTIENREHDLRGGRALLSDHFFYFGDNPVQLPDNLLAIVKDNQGHKSVSNAPFVEPFIAWIESLGHPVNSLLGEPQWDLFSNTVDKESCSKGRCGEAQEDEKAPNNC